MGDPALIELRRPWGTITAAVTGRGETVVLLHPLALSALFWAPVAAALSPVFRVVAVDARGHGNSRWDGSPFSIADLAEDAAAVCNYLGASGVRLLGMSMGGCAALTLAATRPGLVRALVLADTTADYGPDKAARWAERAAKAADEPRRAQLEFQVPRWFTAGFTLDHPGEVKRVCAVFAATDSQAHATACRALGTFAGTELLGQIKCPAHIVVGEQDEATPPGMARALHSGIPNADLEILPGKRHFGLIEVPAVWSRLFGTPAGA